MTSSINRPSFIGKFLFLLFLPAFLLQAEPGSLVSFAGGVFDLMRERHRTAEFSIEYKAYVSALTIPRPHVNVRPLLGAMATVSGSAYFYGGLNFDLIPSEHLVIVPGFAAGWYLKGKGKDLGYPLEFRSGIELAWRFSDERRLGVHFYHLSNASIGDRNPGEESLVLFYDIPLRGGFPFSSRD